MPEKDRSNGVLRTLLIGIPFGILGAIGAPSLQWAASWIVNHAGVGFLAATALQQFGLTLPTWAADAGMGLLLGAILVVAVTDYLPTLEDRLGGNP